MNRSNSITDIVLQDQVTAVSNSLAVQVLNDHPDVDTVSGGAILDKQALSYVDTASVFRPKSLDSLDIVGFDSSAQFAVQYRLGNYNATVDPTSSDTTNQGYSEGSWWVNTVTDQAFICVDSTPPAAAIWKQVTI